MMSETVIWCSQLDAAPLRRSPWKLSGLGVEWTACCVLSYCEVLVTVAREASSSPILACMATG